ncbi:hypothetical protein [Mucisphaera sp.]|uniref:hypothetical protein n=1 Tax=Mucisphaera sp. TaxID=2913024 RepID=UPI003D153538
MSRVGRLLARAQRRAVVVEALVRLGFLLGAAVLVGLGLLLLERRAGYVIEPWLYGVMPGLALVAAVVWAWAVRPSGARLAAVLDDRLGLRDRLSTALYVSAGVEGETDFGRRVLAEAEEASGGRPVSGAIPLRFGWGWRLVGVGLVVFAAGWWLIPAVEVEADDSLGGVAGVEPEQTEAERAAEEEAVRLLRELREEERDLADAAAREEMLARMAELAEAGTARPELRDEAEAVVSELEQDLAAAQEQSVEQAESLANDLSRLDLPEPGRAQELTEALRRGDFDSAVEALREMEEQLASEEMTDAERQALAEQFDDLAEQLQEISDQQQERSEVAESELEQMLQEAGMSEEQIQELRDQNFDPEAMREMAVDELARQMRREGESMEEARERAEQMAEQMAQAAQEAMEQSEQQGQNSESTEGLSQALERLSRAIEQGQGEGGAAAGAQERMRQMGGAQRSAEELAEGRQRALEALDRMASAEGGQEGGREGEGMGEGGEGGMGGREGGYGEGNEVLGDTPTEVTGYTPETTDDLRESQPGRVITSWGPNGGPTEATSRMRFDQTVQEARDSAERAVSEDRVPRRYHRAIQRYFEQLPEAGGGGAGSSGEGSEAP